MPQKQQQKHKTPGSKTAKKKIDGVSGTSASKTRKKSKIDEVSETPASKTPEIDEKSAEWLPSNVIAFACITGRQRFFVPGKNNTFAGVQCDNVMFDSGCSSLLLPFPPTVEALKPFAKSGFTWNMFRHHTLTITRAGGKHVGQMKLATSRAPIDLPRLRFVVGPQDAKELTEEYPEKFRSTQLVELRTFAKRAPAEPRSHALIGQAILRNYCTLQVGSLMVLFDQPFDAANGPHYEAALDACDVARREMVAFPGFDDLKDDDHCGDDEEEERRMARSLEDIDQR